MFKSTLITLAVCYVAVLAAIAADLVTGLRRARAEQRAVTSRGFRRTVAKTASYYSALFSLTIIDAILIAAACGLSLAGASSFPAFPYVTTLGALGLVSIEVKSILENTGLQIDFKAALSLISRLLTSWKVTIF